MLCRESLRFELRTGGFGGGGGFVVLTPSPPLPLPHTHLPCARPARLRDATATVAASSLLAPSKLYAYFGFGVDVLKYWAKFSKLYGLLVVEANRFRYTSNTGLRVCGLAVDDAAAPSKEPAAGRCVVLVLVVELELLRLNQSQLVVLVDEARLFLS